MKKVCLIGIAESDAFYIHNNLFSQNGYFINEVYSNYALDTIQNRIGFDALKPEKIVEDNDIIIICESLQCSDAYIYSLLKQIIPYKKEIYNYHKLSQDTELEINHFAEIHKCKYSSFNVYDDCLKYVRKNKVTIPIIYIMSLFKDMEKLDVELSLYKEMKDMGYKVGLLASNNIAELFGCKVFPYSIFSNYNKNIVDDFESCVADYITQNDYDILIIGVSSLLFSPYDPIDTVSLPLYTLTKCCPPDYVILNILQNTIKNNNLSDIDSCIVNNIHQALNVCIVTNIIDDIAVYEVIKPNRSFRTNTETVLAHLDQIGTNQILVINKHNLDYSMIVHDMEEKLSDKKSYVVIGE